MFSALRHSIAAELLNQGSHLNSIKFNADQKLLDFIDKKFSKIEKFNDAITGVDVALSLLPD